MAAEPLCLSKDAIFLMNNMVMVVTFSTVEVTRSHEQSARITSLGGQEPYNSSQTQSSDAASSGFLYLSKPVGGLGVQDSLTKL